jgi:hypothetical protein
VKFIDLKDYPEFFKDMDRGFPVPPPPQAASMSRVMTLSAASRKLEVQQVGDFEASFVPTVGDFARLDERFRLPEGTWKDLPAYKDYGFAVFKLKPGAMRVHPMAFSFPRQDPHTYSSDRSYSRRRRSPDRALRSCFVLPAERRGTAGCDCMARVFRASAEFHETGKDPADRVVRPTLL